MRVAKQEHNLDMQQPQPRPDPPVHAAGTRGAEVRPAAVGRLAFAPATLITFPPSLDCELARFLLAHYGVPHEERRHAFIFCPIVTLWHAGTIHFPLLYNAEYKLDTVRKMIDHFDPLGGEDRRLLPAGPDRAQVDADWIQFNGTLGTATAAYAYYHLLPLKPVMIRPLSEGTPAFEAWTVRVGYPLYAWAISKGLKLSPEAERKALDTIHAVADAVDARLADGRRYFVGDRFSLSDMAFAVALGPLVLPDQYSAPIPRLAELPAPLKATYAEMRARPAGQFALRIYRDHRDAAPRVA